MGPLETRWRHGSTRRAALRGLAGFLTASPLLHSQQDPFRDHSRVPAMDELRTALDFEPVAYAKLPREAYDYMALGVENEFTLRRNREAFEWVSLVPKGVVDASTIETAADVLGTRMAFPVMLAPSASQAQLHPEGEMAAHRGATAASGTPMIVSHNASYPMDKIAAAAKGPLWYQLYGMEEFDDNVERVEQAQAAGCGAIVLTVDGQAGTYRERLLHNRHLGAPSDASRRPNPRGARQRRPPLNPYRLGDARLWLDWAFIDKLRPYVHVPFLVKGILTGEDAAACVERGMSGIVISNHGGRSMDYAPSTLEVLPEIAGAVRGRLPVLIDGGFRRGSDVLKALALGASAVCLGRVPRWGLAAYGPAGVQRILEIVQAELVMAMAHIGRPTLASIDRSLVRTDFS